MAIDYSGSFPCKVRATVSEEDLLRMEKARNRANVVLEIMRARPHPNQDKPESEWTFVTARLRPDSPEEVEMRIADCLAEAAPLEALARNCEGCPSNVRSAEFGCGGAIHYPITTQAERWLISRLPADLNTPRGQLLNRAIADFQYDGAGIDASRHRKEVYESDVPLERKWGSFFSKKTRITSSQILHMTFAVGSLQPTHAKMLAFYLGFLNDDLSLSKDPDNSAQPGDDPRIIELKYFFSVAALAGINSIPVFVDA